MRHVMTSLLVLVYVVFAVYNGFPGSLEIDPRTPGGYRRLSRIHLTSYNISLNFNCTV